MIRLSLSLLLATFALATAQPAPDSWPDPFEMTFGELDEVTLEPERVELSNGMVVYLLTDSSLPLTEGLAYVRAPSLYDPEGKIGLAAMTADLLRTGGAGERSADEVDETLEFLAASVEGSASNNSAAVSFSALSDNIDEVLEVFGDVLQRPQFSEDRLELLRGRTLEELRRQNDDPVGIAQREFVRRVAEGHPVGEFPTVETVQSVTRDDVVSFYERYYAPNETVLAVSGDFERDEMVEKLEATFSDWERVDVNYPELPEFDPTPEPRVYYAPKETTQSVIFMGHPSVLAYSPNYADLTVANGILGGEGFSSRITTEIRTRRGLAYATGSGLTQGYQYPGFFYAYSLSRGDATGQVLNLLQAEIEGLQQEGVTEAELEQQKETLLSRAVFRFTSSAQVAQRSAQAEFLDLEENYYEDYINGVQEVSAEDVQEVARSELRPDGLVVMVVGDASQFDMPLEEFGEVVTIELEGTE